MLLQTNRNSKQTGARSHLMPRLDLYLIPIHGGRSALFSTHDALAEAQSTDRIRQFIDWFALSGLRSRDVEFKDLPELSRLEDNLPGLSSFLERMD